MSLESEIAQLNESNLQLDVNNINELVGKAKRNEQIYMNQIDFYKLSN